MSEEIKQLEISDDIKSENIKTLANLILDYDRSGSEKSLSDAVALARGLLT